MSFVIDGANSDVVNYTLSYFGYDSSSAWSVIVYQNTGTSPVKILNVKMYCASGVGTFTAGNTVTGNGNPINIPLHFGLSGQTASSTSASQNVTATVSPSGGAPDTSQMNTQYTFTFTNAVIPAGAIGKVYIFQSDVPSGSCFCIKRGTDGASITATLEVAEHTITATAGSHGAISPSGAVTVSDGGNKTFTITPNTGYQVADVKVDGVSKGSITSYTFTNVTSDHTIQATFEVQTFTITPSVSGNGTITPSTAQTVQYGGSKTFYFAPSTGGKFVKLEVDGTTQTLSQSGVYTFTNVTANHTIKAVFSSSTVTVTFDPNGGTRTGGGALVQTINYGESVTNPPIVTKTNKAFKSWSRTYTNVTADITTVAIWDGCPIWIKTSTGWVPLGI